MTVPAAPEPPARTLDVTDVYCPVTFLKVKRALERMRTGELLEVRLCGPTARENVPAAVRREGHEVLVLDLEAAPAGAAGEYWRLRIRKRAARHP